MFALHGKNLRCGLVHTFSYVSLASLPLEKAYNEVREYFSPNFTHLIPQIRCGGSGVGSVCARLPWTKRLAPEGDGGWRSWVWGRYFSFRDPSERARERRGVQLGYLRQRICGSLRGEG